MPKHWGTCLSLLLIGVLLLSSPNFTAVHAAHTSAGSIYGNSNRGISNFKAYQALDKDTDIIVEWDRSPNLNLDYVIQYRNKSESLTSLSQSQCGESIGWKGYSSAVKVVKERQPRNQQETKYRWRLQGGVEDMKRPSFLRVVASGAAIMCEQQPVNSAGGVGLGQNIVVHFTSTPPGATVTINGKLLGKETQESLGAASFLPGQPSDGKTNTSMSIHPFSKQLSVTWSHPNYPSKSRLISDWFTNGMRVHANLTETEERATIKITSTPAGATILLDQGVIPPSMPASNTNGTTPLIIRPTLDTSEAPTKHMIKFKMPGKEDGAIQVSFDRDNELHWDFNQNTGSRKTDLDTPIPVEREDGAVTDPDNPLNPGTGSSAPGGDGEFKLNACFAETMVKFPPDLAGFAVCSANNLLMLAQYGVYKLASAVPL